MFSTKNLVCPNTTKKCLVEYRLYASPNVHEPHLFCKNFTIVGMAEKILSFTLFLISGPSVRFNETIDLKNRNR